ncbi:MAG: bifunctional oligoribonuclease/PAP phosphatase NrnA [Verrucomicrobiales bacterium]|jgi:phosphoesterase RecJ-like protein
MPEVAQHGLAEIAAAIRAAERILVLGHVRPDGDAIGSQIALGSSLREIGKEVLVLNEDGCPSNLVFLPESDMVHRPGGDDFAADLCVALDTANRERLGAGCLAAATGIPKLINIDHHVSNEGYGDLTYVNASAPATGEIIFELLVQEGLPLTPVARDCLFVAISTDTGAFRYPATTARTYEIAAELIRSGADCGALSSSIYECYPFRRLELLRELLGVLRLSSGGRVASWALDAKTKVRLSLKPEDSESLTDLIRAVDTVDVAVFFEELDGGAVRISMRSKRIEAADVCEICACFGGGGHSLASGARMKGQLDNVIEEVLSKIHESLR